MATLEDFPEDKWPPKTREDALALLHHLGMVERDIERRRSAVRERMSAVLAIGRSHGVPWADLAQAAGLSSAAVAQQRSAQPPEAEVPEGSEALPVTAAAERLGIARKTVYAWIADGRLATVASPSGRTLVIMPPELGNAPSVS